MTILAKDTTAQIDHVMHARRELLCAQLTAGEGDTALDVLASLFEEMDPEALDRIHPALMGRKYGRVNVRLTVGEQNNETRLYYEVLVRASAIRMRVSRPRRWSGSSRLGGG